MKILIVEDDDPIRTTLQDLLELNGHEVLAAANGRNGIALAAHRPDSIFCDIKMPEMDGFAVIEEIRRQQSGQLVPFVFLTGNVDRADQRRGMALGADDYITKPFTEKEILSAIEARSRRQKPLIEKIEQLTEQRRRQLGASWSHELMTPLNGILGGLELLQLELESMGREDLQPLLTIIRAGAERQEKLSRKLIRYFELEGAIENPPAIRSVCDVPAAVRTAVEAAAPAEKVRMLQVRCEPGNVALPQGYLTDAIAELIGNALRYTAPEEPVRVTGVRQGDYYSIEVIDHGPGMSAEQRSAIAPFTQFERSKQEQQGLGLGLAIVSMIARLGGGKMTISPGSGGRGLNVTLLLRLLCATPRNG